MKSIQSFDFRLLAFVVFEFFAVDLKNKKMPELPLKKKDTFWMSFRRLLHNFFILYDTSFFTLENPIKDVGIEIGIDIFGSAVGKKRSTTKCLLNYENINPRNCAEPSF
jgi:hypothetical protein